MTKNIEQAPQLPPQGEFENMNTKHGTETDETTLVRIDSLLEKLSCNATNANLPSTFQRHAINNRGLTKLASNYLESGGPPQSIPSAELLRLQRGAILTISAVPINVRFLVWCRQSAIKEHADQALLSFRNGSIVSAATSLRSILEQIGNAAMLEKKITEISAPTDDEKSVAEWIVAIEEVVDQSLFGMRVDYWKIIEYGLRTKKNIDYKPAAHEQNMGAKDLLNGIDRLGKKVVGSRNAYSFLCEFTHPNLASVWTHYDLLMPKMSISEMNIYTAQHQAGQPGAVFMGHFGAIFAEAVEIIAEGVSWFHGLSVSLNGQADDIGEKARWLIRRQIKRNTLAFDRSETCPCNSGKSIRGCCGRLVKDNKFGNLAALGVRFWP